MAKKPQIKKFRDKARELGADERADKFDEVLRRIGKKTPTSKDVEDVAEIIGQTDPNADLGKRKPRKE